MIRDNSRREGILVLGGTGLLGSSLVPHLAAQGHRVVSHGSRSTADLAVDFTDASAVTSALSTLDPRVIVNLIGLTNVDECEKDPDSSYRINTLTSENVATWVQRQDSGCHLIQISTDHVYDGPGPHREDNVTLRNYYAFSKYCAERAALGAGATVLRTNFFGRSRCKSRSTMTDWIHASLVSGSAISIFDDVLFSPLSMHTLCRMIEVSVLAKLPGVYNLGSAGGMSKAEFSVLFAEQCGLASSLMSRTSIDSIQPALTRRPKDMRMLSSRFEDSFGQTLPTLDSEVRMIAREYREEA